MQKSMQNAARSWENMHAKCCLERTGYFERGPRPAVIVRFSPRRCSVTVCVRLRECEDAPFSCEGGVLIHIEDDVGVGHRQMRKPSRHYLTT